MADTKIDPREINAAWDKALKEAGLTNETSPIMFQSGFFSGFEAGRERKWTPITSDKDLEQPPGAYWITYIDDDAEHVASDRIYANVPGGDKFPANTVAYMRVEQPEPWRDK